MQKWIECRVCGHAFQIERFENDDGTGWDEDFGDEVSLTIWYPGMTQLGWRERFDSVWRLLTGRRPEGEHVTLSLTDAQELARYLLVVSSANHPKASVGVSATNTNVTYMGRGGRVGG